MVASKKIDFQEYFSDNSLSWTSGAHNGANGYYPLARKRMEKSFDLIRKHCEQVGRVIDFGSGPGIFASSLSVLGFNVLGIDFSTPMIKLANSLVHSPQMNLSFKESKWEDAASSTNDSSVDMVTALGFIYYLDNIDSFTQEVVRILKTGGKFLVSFRNKDFDRSANLFSSQANRLQSINNTSLIPILDSMINSLSTTPNSDDADSAVPQIKLPSHSLTEIDESFRLAGLKRIDVVGLHPHLLHPALNDDGQSRLTDILSTPLDNLPDAPLEWFSHFICLFEKE